VARLCKVLIVEDNDDVRGLMEEMFDAEGYQIRAVPNATEMRNAIAAAPDWDMLVIDMTLPGPEDGIHLANEMVTQGYHVVLVTGNHLLVDRLDESGHPYLLKPFRVHSLLELIDRLLREAANECQRAARRA